MLGVCEWPGVHVGLRQRLAGAGPEASPQRPVGTETLAPGTEEAEQH